MQSVSSRIWTRVAVFITYDDNHYTTGIYVCMYVFMYMCLSILTESISLNLKFESMEL